LSDAAIPGGYGALPANVHRFGLSCSGNREEESNLPPVYHHSSTLSMGTFCPVPTSSS
jgi:hypothetical protein